MSCLHHEWNFFSNHIHCVHVWHVWTIEIWTMSLFGHAHNEWTIYFHVASIEFEYFHFFFASSPFINYIFQSENDLTQNKVCVGLWCIDIASYRMFTWPGSMCTRNIHLWCRVINTTTSTFTFTAINIFTCIHVNCYVLWPFNCPVRVISCTDTMYMIHTLCIWLL